MRMSRCEVETLGTLVEMTFFLLVTFSLTEEIDIIISRIGWEKDRVGLIMKSFYLVCPFLCFLSTLEGVPFFEGTRRRKAWGRYDNGGRRDGLRGRK